MKQQRFDQYRTVYLKDFYLFKIFLIEKYTKIINSIIKIFFVILINYFIIFNDFPAMEQ